MSENIILKLFFIVIAPSLYSKHYTIEYLISVWKLVILIYNSIYSSKYIILNLNPAYLT